LKYPVATQERKMKGFLHRFQKRKIPRPGLEKKKNRKKEPGRSGKWGKRGTNDSARGMNLHRGTGKAPMQKKRVLHTLARKQGDNDCLG